MNIYDLFDSNKKPSKPTVSESRIEIIHEFAEDTDLFTSAGLNGVAATQDSDNVASPVGSGVEEGSGGPSWPEVISALTQGYPDIDPTDALKPLMQKYRVSYNYFDKLAQQQGYKDVFDAYAEFEELPTTGPTMSKGVEESGRHDARSPEEKAERKAYIKAHGHPPPLTPASVLFNYTPEVGKRARDFYLRKKGIPQHELDKMKEDGVAEAIETIQGREYPVDPGLYYVWAWDGAAVIYGEYNTPEQAEMHLPHIEQKAIKRVGPYVKGAFRVSDGRNLLRRYGVAVRDVTETSIEKAEQYLLDVTKKQAEKLGGVQRDMYGKIEKTFGPKGPQRKKGVDRALNRVHGKDNLGEVTGDLKFDTMLSKLVSSGKFQTIAKQWADIIRQFPQYQEKSQSADKIVGMFPDMFPNGYPGGHFYGSDGGAYQEMMQLWKRIGPRAFAGNDEDEDGNPADGEDSWHSVLDYSENYTDYWNRLAPIYQILNTVPGSRAYAPVLTMVWHELFGGGVEHGTDDINKKDVAEGDLMRSAWEKNHKASTSQPTGHKPGWALDPQTKLKLKQRQQVKQRSGVEETAPLSRDARRELVAPTDRDTIRRELWKYVRSLDQEGSSNRAHAMAYSCPTWGQLYRQFHNDISQLLSRAPTELLAQALQEIQSKFQVVAEGYVDRNGPIENTPQVVWWRKTQGGDNIYWKVFPSLSTASRARENLANSLYKKYGKNFTIGNAKFDPLDPAQCRAADADRYMTKKPGVTEGSTHSTTNESSWSTNPLNPMSPFSPMNPYSPLKPENLNHLSGIGVVIGSGLAVYGVALAQAFKDLFQHPETATMGEIKKVQSQIRELYKKTKILKTDQGRAKAQQDLTAAYEVLEQLKTRVHSGLAEAAGKPLSVEQLATISDEALDAAYHYGRSTPGNTFGWQANLKSAAYAKKMIDSGETDIEKISDAIHRGWNVTAQAFIQNPMIFDDSKTMAPEKLQAKLAQRQRLVTQNYAQLPEDEKEKDRVVARAMLQAITGEPGVAEGRGTLSPEVQTKVEQMAQRFATLLRNNILRTRKENVSQLGYSKEQADQEAKEAVQQIRFVAKNLSKNWQASDWIIDVADTGAKGIYNILMNQKSLDEFNWESKYPGITQALNQAFAHAWQSVDGLDQQGVAESAVPSWLAKGKQVRHEGISNRPCTVQGIEGGKVVIRDWTGKLFKVLAATLKPVTGVASEDSNMPVAVDSISPIHGVTEYNGNVNDTQLKNVDADNHSQGEGDFVKNQLHTMKRVITHLDNAIGSNEDLPDWVQSEIAQAVDKIVGVMDYSISSKEQDIEKHHGGSALMKEGSQSFRNGMQVKLTPEYADRPDEIFTVSHCDQERGRCWIGDKQGRGWSATFDQLIPVEDDDDELDIMENYLQQLKRAGYEIL